MFKPPKIKTYVVHRKKTIQKASETLYDTGYLNINDLDGMMGIGKTILIATLFEDVSSHNDCYPIYLPMERFNTTPGHEEGQFSNSPNLIRNFEQYKTFLKTLAKGLPDSRLKRFSAKVDVLCKSILAERLNKELKVTIDGAVLKSGNIRIESFSQIINSQVKTGDVVVELPTDFIVMSINQAKDAITELFIHEYNRKKSPDRIALFFDDFENTLVHEMSLWILVDLIPWLKNTVVVIARVESTRPLPGAKDHLVHLRLGNFSLSQVREFLQNQLNCTLLPEGLAERIYQFSHGHPQTVALSTDRAKDHGLDRPDLLKIFNRMPKKRKDQLRRIVEQIINNIDDADVREALETVSILRRFNTNLLAHLMFGDPSEAENENIMQQTIQLVDRLKVYSFVEEYADHYELHNFIRSVIADKLKKDDPGRYEKLHLRAARHYSQMLKDWEEDQRDSKSYERWFRYESVQWQALKSEWLYHIAQTKDRKAAGLEFAMIYFDAFWWWGCYLEFPFCERLLSDWDQSQQSPEDRVWLDLIRKFHDSYPAGYDKYGKGDWEQARTALISILSEGDIDKSILKISDEGQLKLKAFIKIFLADFYRYHIPEPPKAGNHYEKAYRKAFAYHQEACEIFDTLDDTWNLTWGLFYWADMCFDFKKFDKAREYCRKSLDLAPQIDSEVPEYEVIANNHRLMADLFWQQKDLKHAFQFYAQAVLFAYLFHGLPPPPDFYTLAFYREMMARIQTRLQQLLKEDRQIEVVEFCNYLHNFWKPYWDLVGDPPLPDNYKTLLSNNRTEELNTYLFPSEPSVEDLEKHGSDYVNNIRVIVDEMAEIIENQFKEIRR